MGVINFGSNPSANIWANKILTDLPFSRFIIINMSHYIRCNLEHCLNPDKLDFIVCCIVIDLGSK